MALLLCTSPALAGPADDAAARNAAGTAAQAPSVNDDNDDAVLKLAEPDFTLIALPTALRLPKFKSAFRVTHRFTRPLGEGDFGDLASDLFGIDSGAVIGLEYRFGIVPNGEIGFRRTNNRTIEFSSRYGLARQGSGMPLEIAALLAIEGTNNFKDSYTPTIGVLVSRRVGDRAAFYVEPMWMNNTNPLPSALVDDNNTFLIGVGTRIRVRPTVYVVGDFSPRVAGFRPGVNQGGIAIEKRAGGHTFQLNFSNGFGTTMGQLARGGPPSNDWYMGFSISRKFF